MQKKPHLVFHVEETATEVVLFFDEEEVGRAHIEPNRELLEKLLPAIDGLLSKHGISSHDVADIHVESALPDGYSSRRVAETVANIWKWSRL